MRSFFTGTCEKAGKKPKVCEHLSLDFAIEYDSVNKKPYSNQILFMISDKRWFNFGETRHYETNPIELEVKISDQSTQKELATKTLYINSKALWKSLELGPTLFARDEEGPLEREWKLSLFQMINLSTNFIGIIVWLIILIARFGTKNMTKKSTNYQVMDQIKERDVYN